MRVYSDSFYWVREKNAFFSFYATTFLTLWTHISPLPIWPRLSSNQQLTLKSFFTYNYLFSGSILFFPTVKSPLWNLYHVRKSVCIQVITVDCRWVPIHWDSGPQQLKASFFFSSLFWPPAANGVPIQGSDLIHSCGLCCSCHNTRCLTHPLCPDEDWTYVPCSRDAAYPLIQQEFLKASFLMFINICKKYSNTSLSIFWKGLDYQKNMWRKCCLIFLEPFRAISEPGKTVHMQCPIAKHASIHLWGRGI